MSNLTLVEKAAATDKFVEWLKRRYVMPAVVISITYKPVSYLYRKTVTARLIQDGLNMKIEVATDRELNRVMQAAAHEFAHVKQIAMDGVLYRNIKSKHETEAWLFSAHELKTYYKEVGDNWR